MPRPRPVGERALLVESVAPAAAAAWIRRRAADGHLAVVDVVPAACTVLVTFASRADVPAARAALAGLPTDLADAGPSADPPLVRIPVRFDGPDLAGVAAHAGLDPDGVVRLLVDSEFTVAFCGFAPGFGYLAGLPPALHVPRRAEPRTRVPAGALAVADTWAAVYPRPGPGGWQLLGRTDVVLFDVHRRPPAVLVAGTRVRIEAVP